MQKVKIGLYYFLILVYVSGTIGMVLKPSFFLPYTPFTLVYTVFVFIIFQPIKNYKYVISFAVIALIGFLSEVIGVKTDWVFGQYHYGNSLGFKLLNVPIIISLNWALLVNASILIASKFSKHKLLLPLISATIATSLDFLMEQVAPNLNFWYFKGGFAGLHNYIGWFIICFTTTYFLSKHLIKGDKKIATTIIALQVLFFGVIYLFKHK